MLRYQVAQVLARVVVFRQQASQLKRQPSLGVDGQQLRAIDVVGGGTLAVADDQQVGHRSGAGARSL